MVEMAKLRIVPSELKVSAILQPKRRASVPDRSAAPRRRYSSSERKRSRLCSGYFFTHRQGLTPSGRISHTSARDSIPEKAPSVLLAWPGT